MARNKTHYSIQLKEEASSSVMPLLRGQPFKPINPPADLKPNEEVFFCQYTKEIFRSYDEFFGRQFLCKSSVWSCQFTDQQNITYEQAQNSEEEYLSALGSIQPCQKKQMLSLAHESCHTNITHLIKEVFEYFKGHYIVGEEVDYHTSKRSSKRVIIMDNHPGQPQTLPTTVSSPVVSIVINEQQATPIKQTIPSTSNDGLSASPLSPFVHVIPKEYLYSVKVIDSDEDSFTTTYQSLSRPKKSLTKEKIRLFLKLSTYRDTDKSPLLVKPEYVTEYELGPSSIKQKPTIITHSAPESRKRTSSQTSIDSFLTPSSNPKKPLRPIFFNPFIKDTPKSASSKSSSKKTPRSKSPKKRLLKRSSLSDSTTSKTPIKKKTPNKISTNSLLSEAKKILKKTKNLKQMDVRKSLIKKRSVSGEGGLLKERRKSFDELRARRLTDKEKIKQDRIRRNQEMREKRKKERLKQIEWMKPREDLLCEDSKLLPRVQPIPSTNELFPDIIVIMEFIHHYGPVFNISDAIPDCITYETLKEALYSYSTETILFDLVKFLLQAIFSAMEEEHEDMIDSNIPSSPVAITEDNDRPNDGGQTDGTTTTSGSRRSSVGSIPVEGMEDQQSRQEITSITMASIKTSALGHARWPYITQASSLQKLALNVHTCSEVLRLHLMSCGGYKGTSDRQWFRFCNRGGYTDGDDPVVELRLSNPSIIESLLKSSFFDMKANEKAQILSCLCSQLLMFSASREAMDEILTQMKQIRKQLRELRYSIGGSKKKTKQNTTKDEETAVDGGKMTEENKMDDNNNDINEEEKKAKVLEEIGQLERELYPLSAAICLRPLGCDRYRNKYWLFPSVSGLYIENVTMDSFDSTGHPLINAPSNDTKCTCTVSSLHDLSLCCDSSWSLVSSKDDFQTLLAALNPRGIREANLKLAFEKLKDLIEGSLTESPFLNPVSGNRLPDFIYSCANDGLELQLREQILDLEEKLYLGNLGYVRDSISRKEWRERIENSGAAQVYAVANGGIVRVNGVDNVIDERDAVSNPSNPVTELANALLQIQNGIEKKCLLSPLGTAVDVKKKGKNFRKNGVSSNSPICIEQWRTSLQKATSFSQIFVHLSTLERSVAWNKSLMKMRCRFCRRKGGDEYMLLCDGCDHGYHTYCLRPPLVTIPEGDWFCNDCCPVTPVKRRRTVSMVSLKELSDSESEEEEGDDEDDSQESDNEEAKKRPLRASTIVQSKQYQPKKTRGRHSAPQPLTRSKKRIKLDNDDISSNSSCVVASSRAEMIITAIIDVRCSKRAVSTVSQNKAQHTLELQLCKALLEEMKAHASSWPFLNPIRRREFPDYHEIITKPIDLKTMSLNISTHKYNGLDDFLTDVDLLFVNCSTYHKRHSKVAKAGATLRKFVEQRYSDLGLGNLANVTISGIKQLRSSGFN